MSTLEILKEYDKTKHEKMIENDKLKHLDLKYVFSEKWQSDNDVPYVIKTHLLDSYYCLPTRPDMAFTFLWKCINNAYTEIFIQKNPTSIKQLSDSKSLDALIDAVMTNLNTYINDETTIKDVIEKYIKNMPEKLTRFVANFILKNYVIEKKYYDDSQKSAGIANKYISSSYNTFKSQFKIIHNAITATYGEAYSKITDPVISGNTIQLNISNENEEKSHAIIRSLGNKLKELLVNRSVTIQDSGNENTLILSLSNDKEYINFILRNFLYAIRNNTVHGKIASRLNSHTKNKDSYSSSTYVYLLGYMFLSIALYELDYLNASDLSVNIENLEKNILNI